jgi:hypothetical protein
VTQDGQVMPGVPRMPVVPRMSALAQPNKSRSVIYARGRLAAHKLSSGFVELIFEALPQFKSCWCLKIVGEEDLSYLIVKRVFRLTH